MTTLSAEPATRTTEHRGSVLSVLQELLNEQRSDAIIELFSKLVQRNSELELRLAQLVRHKSREGVSAAQLLLALEGLAKPSDEQRQELDTALQQASGIAEAAAKARAEAEEKAKQPPKQPPARRPFPPGLQRKDNPLTVAPAERPCPSCGGERKCIGHDITEVLELKPAEVYVRRDLREKLACAACQGELARGPMGDKVVSCGRFGVQFVAELLVHKYVDGLPLHRQRQIFERLGISLPVSTLADQVGWATDLLRPLWRAALVQVLSSYIMNLDGTGLPVLDRDHPKGIKLGALWGYVGDFETAVYLYCSTGKKDGQRPDELGPQDVLKLRSGKTVADASNLFDLSFQRDDLIECGCNMHARRNFIKAFDAGDKRAANPIAAFKKIYDLEEECKDLSDDDKLDARQQRSKPVYDALIRWCQGYKLNEPPKSPMGKAVRYLLNHQTALTQFLHDARVPPDNGAVERLHVRVALTRKNFLFAGSHVGAERAAIAYTILGSCRLAGVNPSQYLADLLPKLARGIRLVDAKDLLPAAWKRSQQAQHH